MARIYTERMQEVLDPISASIALLLSKIEESEETGSTLSDLSGPSAAVYAACQGLANAGRSLCDGSDPFLQKDMPPAADAVEKSAKDLAEACVSLKDDPKNTAAKRKLESGVRGILEHTTKLLEVFDDQTVRELVAAADAVLAALRSLKKNLTAQETVDKVRGTNAMLVKLARKTEARRQELQQNQYRDEVQRECSTLRTASPLLVSAMKACITSGGDAASQQARDGLVAMIQAATERIRFLVQLKFYRDEDLSKGSCGTASLAADAVYKLLAQAMLGGATDPASQQKLSSELEKFLSQCERVAKMCADPEKKKDILDSVQKCRKLQGKMQKLAEKLEKNPDDAELKRKYAKKAKKLNEEVAALQAKALRALAEQKEKALSDTHTGVVTLFNAVEENPAAAEAATKALAAGAKELENVAEVVAEFAADPSKAHAVHAAAKAVNQYTPVVSASGLAAADEKKQGKGGNAAQEHAQRVRVEYVKKVNDLADAMDAAMAAPELTAAANESAILAAIPKVAAAAQKQDKTEYTVRLEEIGQNARRLIQLCDSESENTGDSTAKGELQARAKALSEATANHRKAADDVMANRTGIEQKKKLEIAEKALASEAIAARKALGGESTEEMERKEKERLGAILKEQEEARRKKEEEARNAELKKKREAEEKARKEEEERKRQLELERLAAENAIKLVEEEKKIQFQNNAIGNAAQDLHKEANQWDETQNSVVSYARLIAEKFNRMAEIHDKPNSKRELIDLAKEIAQAAQAAAKIARKYAANCADRRLKNELDNTVAMMETISSQLRIIATVKASNYMDNSADEQLTVCAKNLMTSVQACVGQCHAASLKPVNKDDPVLKSVQWRKKVYRDRADAKW